MFNKLIKYLEENFNAEFIPSLSIETKFETFNSTLDIRDLPKLAKAFKGSLKMDEDGDAHLLYRDGSLCLWIDYSSLEDNSKEPSTNKVEVTIFSN